MSTKEHQHFEAGEDQEEQAKKNREGVVASKVRKICPRSQKKKLF